MIDLVENVKSEKLQSIYHFVNMNDFCSLKVEEEHDTGLSLSVAPRPPTHMDVPRELSNLVTFNI